MFMHLSSHRRVVKGRDSLDLIYEPTLWLKYHISESAPHQSTMQMRKIDWCQALFELWPWNVVILIAIRLVIQMQRANAMCMDLSGINERKEKSTVRCVHCQDTRLYVRVDLQRQRMDSHLPRTSEHTYSQTQRDKRRRDEGKKEEHNRAVPTAIVLAIMHSFVRSSHVAQSPHSHHHHHYETV